MIIMNRLFIILILLITALHPVIADYPELPVFSLSYEVSQGAEEDEESGELTADSLKHTIIFKLKEELSRTFYFVFPLQYSFKEYLEGNQDQIDISKDYYYYIRFSPYLSWDINKKSNLKFYIIGKWYDYESESGDDSNKDNFTLSGQVAWTYKALRSLKILSSIKSEYGLYTEPAKLFQSYNLRLGSSININQYTITGKYNGKIILPLGYESEKEMDMTNSIKIDLQLDLNK